MSDQVHKHALVQRLYIILYSLSVEDVVVIVTTSDWYFGTASLVAPKPTSITSERRKERGGGRGGRGRGGRGGRGGEGRGGRRGERGGLKHM